MAKSMFIYSSSKPSDYSVNLNSTNNKYTHNLSETLQLETKEPINICLMNAVLPYTVANIQNSINSSLTLEWKVVDVENTATINLRTGLYSVATLNSEIQRLATAANIFFDKAIEIAGVDATLHTIIKLKKANMRIRFGNDSFYTLVGETKGATVPASGAYTTDENTAEESPNTAMFNTTTAYVLRCGLFPSSGFSFGNKPNVCAYMPIDVAPWSTMPYTPRHLVEMNAENLRNVGITTFEVELLNQDGDTVNLNGEYFNFTVRITVGL